MPVGFCPAGIREPPSFADHRRTVNISEQVAKADDFLRNRALPLWASAGVDAVAGGFVERLRPDGMPEFDSIKRSLTQARQIYVYSHAATLNMAADAETTAERGIDFLMRYACPDGAANGFVHSLTRDGSVVDPTRDLYDHAFLLFGFSWFYRASGSARVLRTIDELLSAINMLRHSSRLGYAESNIGSLPRRQNPHMHLFEAFLAAYHATGRSSMLERAAEIYQLLVTRFFVGDVLLEYFDNDLFPAPFPAGKIVEPGHHHEWVWLLGEYSRAAKIDTSVVADALYRSAEKFGTAADTGLVINEIWADGRPKDGAKRLWPQTEALKSGIMIAAQTGKDAGEFATPIVDRIFRHFLDPAPPGAWIDRIDAADRPIYGPIPATSFYHLFLALVNYLTAAKSL